jgi:hypothetical protein
MSSSAIFDQNFYLTNNADVVVAISQGNFANALDHFNQFGGKELRAPNATFNPNYYAINNTDVLNAVSAGTFGNVFAHFQEFGEGENRAPNTNLATFDSAAYLTANTDVAAAVTAGSFSSALDHFISFGQTEGRSGSGVTAEATPGSTFTLTSRTDSGASFVGGANADTFNADLVNESGVANVTTLNSTDVLDGAGGTDTLTATYDDAVTATISNIENINLSTRGAVIFDFASVTGMTNLGISASTTASDFNNIQALPTLVSISNQAQDIDLDFAAGAVSGAADTLSLAVSSVTSGDITTDTSIETLSISSGGTAANTINNLITTTGAANLTLTGSAGLTVTTALDAAILTVDASAATGATSILIDQAGTHTLTGGTGNNTFNLGATFTSADIIDGGDGTGDKLSVGEGEASAIVAANSNITNTEILDLTEALANAGAVDLTLFGADAASAPSSLELSAGAIGTSTLTVASGSTIDLEADAGNAVTITVAGSGTSDTVNLTLDNADVAIGNIVATSVETLNIFSTGTADLGSNAIAGTTAVNSLAGTQSIIITGGEAITFTGAVTADVIDGSALTDVLTLTAGSAVSAEVSGGSAADILTMNDANADVITGGAGNDIIQFDVEVTDFVTGGAGNDVFLMGNDTDVAFAGAVITDLATNDDLDLDESALEVNTAGGTAVAELTDYAGADITGADNMLFVTVGSDNTALSSGDIAVLTGKTYANAAAALTDIQTAGARTFTHVALTDEDATLLAYELTSGGVEIALIMNEGAGTTSNGFDAIDVIVTLSGITAASIQTMDIDTVS